MLESNFTSYTVRSGHSELSEEDNIKLAMRNNMSQIGISEYSNLPGDQGEYRLKNMQELESYLESMRYLKIKYKYSVSVYCGLTVEIRDPFSLEINTNWIKFLYSQPIIDYLILAHNNYSDGSHVMYSRPKERKILEQYVFDFKEALLENQILYVSTLDSICLGYKEPSEELEWAIREMFKIARETKTPLGINAHGFGEKEHNNFGYPNKWFWDIASEYNVQTVIELGGYNTGSYDLDLYNKTKTFADDCGLEVLETLIIKQKRRKM